MIYFYNNAGLYIFRIMSVEMPEDDIICCICNKLCSQSLKLSADTNKGLRSNIESCLEQLLDYDAIICYFCRNTFEESFNSVAMYRNKYNLVQKGDFFSLISSMAGGGKPEGSGMGYFFFHCIYILNMENSANDGKSLQSGKNWVSAIRPAKPTPPPSSNNASWDDLKKKLGKN